MPKIAESTVRRLSLYLRFLEEFEREGTATVSSDALAAKLGTTSAQVRKDLSFFGSFGKRGLGYPVEQLTARLRDILGLTRHYRIGVLGAGKIGRALLKYRGFAERGFELAVVYDRNVTKGASISGVPARDVTRLKSDLKRDRMDIAIIATPPEVAQEITDILVEGGVKAILNFAPVQLTVPSDVAVTNVNMALELETLSYALRNHDRMSA